MALTKIELLGMGCTDPDQNPVRWQLKVLFAPIKISASRLKLKATTTESTIEAGNPTR